MPTLCPVAVVAGCKACPIFAICPLKGVIGDQRTQEKAAVDEAAASKPKRKKKR